MVVLVCRGVGRRRVYGQKRGASITLWKNPAFSEFTFAVDKDAAINSLGGEQQWLMEANSRIWQCLLGSMGEELEKGERKE
jgi:hypothetical protein